MSDPEYDADYVEAFNNAQDHELSLQDAERQTTPGGCLSTATIIVAVVIALTFALI